MKKYLYVFLFLCLFLFIPYNKVNANGEIDCDLYKEQIEAVQVLTYNDNNIYVTNEDVYLMAQIVYAESRSEPYEGKVAVASVILNRLQSPGFPKSIEGVIKQKNAFSCLVNGQIDVIPDKASYDAVIEALNGNDPTNKAVFFYNPRIATSNWMKNIGKTNVTPIGNHIFFVVNQ